MLLKIVVGLWFALWTVAPNPIHIVAMLAALFYRRRFPIGPVPRPGSWREIIEQAIVEIAFILLGLGVSGVVIYALFLVLIG